MANFDISLVKTRYFNVRLGDKSVDLLPCTLKLMHRYQSHELDMEELASEILNRNKQGYIFDKDFIGDINYDQLIELVTAYFNWLKNIRGNDPN